MRTTIWVLLVVLALVPSTTQAAFGQVTKAAMGTAVGIGGGAVITLSIVVARATFQGEYLESADDLIHWQSVPMVLTPAVGLFFGLGGRDPLIGSIIGSTSGMLIGAGLGAGVGWLVSPEQEAPWAGGVMGAGIGMTIGGLLLGTRAYLRGGDAEGGEENDPTRLEVRIPI